jgi:hypothetical protein
MNIISLGRHYKDRNAHADGVYSDNNYCLFGGNVSSREAMHNNWSCPERKHGKHQMNELTQIESLP